MMVSLWGASQVEWVVPQAAEGNEPVWSGADLQQAGPAILEMQPSSFAALVGGLCYHVYFAELIHHAILVPV